VWPLLLSCSPPQPACCLMNPPPVTLTYYSHECSTAARVSLGADLSQPCHFLATCLPLMCVISLPPVRAAPLPPPPYLLTTSLSFSYQSSLPLHQRHRDRLRRTQCQLHVHLMHSLCFSFMLGFAVGIASSPMLPR